MGLHCCSSAEKLDGFGPSVCCVHCLSGLRFSHCVATVVIQSIFYSVSVSFIRTIWHLDNFCIPSLLTTFFWMISHWLHDDYFFFFVLDNCWYPSGCVCRGHTNSFLQVPSRLVIDANSIRLPSLENRVFCFWYWFYLALFSKCLSPHKNKYSFYKSSSSGLTFLYSVIENIWMNIYSQSS